MKNETIHAISLRELKNMVPNPCGSGEAARQARRNRVEAGFSLDEVLQEIWHVGYDWWETRLSDRVVATTWEFGSIHQCKVFIDYAGSHPIRGGKVGICLMAQPTRLEAMGRAIHSEWTFYG